jgi:hypothetical protein
MLKRVVLRSLSLLVLLLLASRASAQVYRLASGSEFLEGCISGLCLCPVRLTTQLGGTMRLSQVSDGEFEVRNVDWKVSSDTQPLEFTGDGRYQRRGNDLQREQRLELDLSANGEDPEFYDSGWVPLLQGGDDIDLFLPVFDLLCWGRAFDIRAMPSSTVVTRPRSWSTVKSRW